MTETTDAEAAEILWASSEQGNAAVEAALKKAQRLGWAVATTGIAADIAAVIYAAYLAAGWDAEPDGPDEESEPESSCGEHQWALLKAQDATPKFPFSSPHTAVLARCLECAQPEAWLLIGAWTLEDLQGTEAADKVAYHPSELSAASP